jgi:hypothetical protein
VNPVIQIESFLIVEYLTRRRLEKWHLSSEAKDELRKLIIELQEGIKVEEKNDPIGELTAEVWQAVADGMISEWKWKQKVGKFLKRFSKAIEKPEKMSWKRRT